MLVLSRRLGEAIIIDEQIEIKVVAIMGQKVRLGITAPKHVSIHRAEIEGYVPSERLLNCGIGLPEADLKK
jgi:carbon storage regulator